MRLNKIAGPRPSMPLLMWPLAEFETTWTRERGFPQRVDTVVFAGFWDLAEVTRLAVGDRLIDHCILERAQ